MVWRTEVPHRGPGAELLVGDLWGEPPNPLPPEAHSILRFSAAGPCTILHEPLVKHEKNLGCSACLFTELSSN